MSAAEALDKADSVTGQAQISPLSRALRPQRTRVPGFAYLAVGPTLLIVAIVVGGPLVYSFYLSLHRTNPITKKWIFVGPDNYTAAIGNADFWAAIGRTVYFAGFTLVGSTLLGMAMALVLNQRFSGRGLLRSFVLIPWAMAPVSVGVLWSFVYAGNYGALTGLLNDLGLGRFALPWLGNGFRALNLVALTQVWSQAPLTALMLLAGLQSMPDKPAPRRHAGRRRRGLPLLRHYAALAEAKPPVHLHRDDHQFPDGLRHPLDHDARRSRGGDDSAVVARVSHGLSVPAVWRRGEPALFPHGAELSAGARLSRGVRTAARSDGRIRGRRRSAISEAVGSSSRRRQPSRPRSDLAVSGAGLPAPLRRALGQAGFALLALVILSGRRCQCSRSSS